MFTSHVTTGVHTLECQRIAPSEQLIKDSIVGNRYLEKTPKISDFHNQLKSSLKIQWKIPVSPRLPNIQLFLNYTSRPVIL